MTLETLLAEREIYRHLVAFAYAIDHRAWDNLHDFVHEDATSDLGLGLMNGRAEMIATMQSFLDACGPTQHLIGNVVIDVDGDSAKSRVYINDMHQGLGNDAGKTFSTLGEYHDKWKCIRGKWYMMHRTKLSRVVIGDIAVFGVR